MFQSYLSQFLQFFPCIKVARRIPRVTDENSSGFWSNFFLKFFHRRQGKTCLDRRRNCYYFYIDMVRKTIVIRVVWLWDDYLITIITKRRKCDAQRFRTTISHDKIIRCQVCKTKRMVINFQSLSILYISLRKRVFQHF